MRRKKLILGIVLLLAIGIVGLGYYSNARCASQFQDEALLECIPCVPEDVKVFVYVNGDCQHVELRLRGIGREFEIIDAEIPESRHQFPRVVITTRIAVPFLLRGEWLWEREPLIGGGEKRSCFCFFGFRSLLSRTKFAT